MYEHQNLNPDGSTRSVLPLDYPIFTDVPSFVMEIEERDRRAGYFQTRMPARRTNKVWFVFSVLDLKDRYDEPERGE
jgi:hypothetical protein